MNLKRTSATTPQDQQRRKPRQPHVSAQRRVRSDRIVTAPLAFDTSTWTVTLSASQLRYASAYLDVRILTLRTQEWFRVPGSR